ncbi:MAG: hypothetical protein AAGG07_03645 [Planctomycetota bacterium]
MNRLSPAPLLVALAGLPASVVYAASDELPISQVTLYRAGVAAVERSGNTDSDRVSIDVSADAFDEMLKSLTITRLTGADLTGVTYERPSDVSERPITRSLDEANAVADWLASLRGEALEADVGGGTVSGRIFGVERRPNAEGKNGPILLTLVTDEGLRTLLLDEVRALRFADADRQNEFVEALAAVSVRRDQTVRTAHLNLSGEADARLSLVYTEPAPVWKVTYRLGLPESDDASGSLQAWAVIENDSASDWQNVRLSLASGQPVSFRTEIDSPIHAARPFQPLPIPEAVNAFAYRADKAKLDAAIATDDGLRRSGRSRALQFADVEEVAAAPEGASGAMMQTNAFAGGLATSTRAADRFFFTLETPVSLDAGASAMLPLVTGEAKVERRSIVGLDGGPPRLGAMLTNDTGAALPAGPITVLDGAGFAGDALIDPLQPGEDRLIGFAVDTALSAERSNAQTSTVSRVTIVRGVLRQRIGRRMVTTHELSLRDQDSGRTVLIEHQSRHRWTLEPEQTDSAAEGGIVRRTVELSPGGSTTVRFVEERTDHVTLKLLDASERDILQWARDGAAPQTVLDAFREAARLTSAVDELERAVRKLESEGESIARDQERLRENLRTVDRSSDLASRYLAKLTEQEDRLEAIAGERAQRDRELASARRVLRDFLENTTIE